MIFTWSLTKFCILFYFFVCSIVLLLRRPSQPICWRLQSYYSINKFANNLTTQLFNYSRGLNDSITMASPQVFLSILTSSSNWFLSVFFCFTKSIICFVFISVFFFFVQRQCYYVLLVVVRLCHSVVWSFIELVSQSCPFIPITSPSVIKFQCPSANIKSWFVQPLHTSRSSTRFACAPHSHL